MMTAISHLYKECSYPSDGYRALAASDTCRRLASSAVVTQDESLMWRCDWHEGMVRSGEHGEIVRELDSNAREPHHVRIDPEGCGCTDCLTGYSVPLDAATEQEVRMMLAGRKINATSLTPRCYVTAELGDREFRFPVRQKDTGTWTEVSGRDLCPDLCTHPDCN